jgi:hypothetical protein
MMRRRERKERDRAMSYPFPEARKRDKRYI